MARWPPVRRQLKRRSETVSARQLTPVRSSTKSMSKPARAVQRRWVDGASNAPPRPSPAHRCAQADHCRDRRPNPAVRGRRAWLRAMFAMAYTSVRVRVVAQLLEAGGLSRALAATGDDNSRIPTKSRPTTICRNETDHGLRHGAGKLSGVSVLNQPAGTPVKRNPALSGRVAGGGDGASSDTIAIIGRVVLAVLRRCRWCRLAALVAATQASMAHVRPVSARGS